MDAKNKKRQKAEKKYMRRTAALSLAIGVVLFVGLCLLIRSVPAIQASRIQGFIRMGDYQRAYNAISQLEDSAAAARLTKAADYAQAQDLLNAGDYEAARAAFLSLGDYENAQELAQQSAFLRGEELYAAGDSASAMRMYLLVPDWPGANERMTSIRYQQALAMMSDDKLNAYTQLAALGDYADAPALTQQLAMELTGIADPQAALDAMGSMTDEERQSRAELAALRDKLRQGDLAVGGWHTLGLRRDGTVLAAGRDDAGQCEVDSWRDITQIDAGALHSVGLRSDGTVLAVGDNSHGQCDVSGWQHVIQIACGDYATFALFSDGTVSAVGYLDYADVAAWRNVTLLRAGAYMAAGLFGTGDVYVTHPSAECDDFHALVDIALTTGGVVGLTSAGEAVANFSGFPNWQEVACLSAGSQCVLGIRWDGALLAHFFRSSDAFPVEQWTDVICVTAGGAHSAILTGDGQAHAFGDNTYGQCNITHWDLG